MKDKELSFEQVANELLVNKISTDPSELHGILTGMVSGGMNLDNQDWINSLSTSSLVRNSQKKLKH